MLCEESSPSGCGSLFLVLDLVIITGIHQSAFVSDNGMTTTRTVFRFWLHNKITLYLKRLETRPCRCEQVNQGESAGTGDPEALERLCVLAPCLHDDVQPRPAFNADAFQQSQDRVSLTVVDQEREWYD